MRGRRGGVRGRRLIYAAIESQAGGRESQGAPSA